MDVPDRRTPTEDPALVDGGTSCSCVVVQCCGIEQKVDPPVLVFVSGHSAVAPPLQPGGGQKMRTHASSSLINISSLLSPGGRSYCQWAGSVCSGPSSGRPTLATARPSPGLPVLSQVQRVVQGVVVVFRVVVGQRVAADDQLQTVASLGDQRYRQAAVKVPGPDVVHLHTTQGEKEMGQD